MRQTFSTGVIRQRRVQAHCTLANFRLFWRRLKVHLTANREGQRIAASTAANPSSRRARSESRQSDLLRPGARPFQRAYRQCLHACCMIASRWLVIVARLPLCDEAIYRRLKVRRERLREGFEDRLCVPLLQRPAPRRPPGARRRSKRPVCQSFRGATFR